MLKQMKRLARSIRAALGPPGARERWLASIDKIAWVHPTTEFNDRQPDENIIRIGKGSYFERDVTIWLSGDAGANPLLVLGDRVFVARNCYLGSYQPVTIGDDVQIGAYSYIISANHRFDRRDISIREQGFTGTPVDIGPDVWIGAHVTILPGVTIGKGAIVGAGSVVTKSIPPYQIWAGNPAKFLKDRPNGG